MDNLTTDRRSPLGLFLGQPTPRLCDRVVELLRAQHYSHRINGFAASSFFTLARTRASWLKATMNRLLMDLTVMENVAASSQNQAGAALLLLYEHLLEKPLDRIEPVILAARAPKVTV